MPNYISVVSPAELSAAGIRLRHADAVAIAREVARRVARGELDGVPAPQEIRFGSDGSITANGELPSGRELERAACLLEVLTADAITDVAAPAAFRLIVARAYAKDEAAFASLERFADALEPFSSSDAAEAVRAAVKSWQEALRDVSSTQPPTVLPIRPRANRGKPRSWVAIRAPHSSAGDEGWVRVQEFLLANFDTEDFETGSVSLRPARDRRRSVAVVPELPPAASPTRQPTVVPARQAVWIGAVALGAMLAAVVITWSRPGSPVPADVDLTSSISQAKPAAPAVPQDAVVQDRTQSKPSEPLAETVVALPGATATGPALRRQPRRPYRAQFMPRRVSLTSKEASSSDSGSTSVLAEAAYSPAFASATSAMFYHSGTGPESAIMRADTDTSGAVLRVTSVVGDRGSNFHPRPSPDGKSIAFDSDRDGERGVYVADADGRRVRRVSGAGFAAVPSWSPDGRRLAFVRAEEGRPKVWNIWTVDLASGATARLTSHRYGQPWGASWFPEGNRIAYSHEDRLIVQSLTGEGVRTFTTPVRGRLVRTPAISPDGQRIIFQVRHDGAWLLNLSDDSMHRVLEDSSAEEFTWSADGQRVAYHSRRSGTWGVWIMAPR